MLNVNVWSVTFFACVFACVHCGTDETERLTLDVKSLLVVVVVEMPLKITANSQIESNQQKVKW